jgi:hypothetical protein
MHSTNGRPGPQLQGIPPQFPPFWSNWRKMLGPNDGGADSCAAGRESGRRAKSGFPKPMVASRRDPGDVRLEASSGGLMSRSVSCRLVERSPLLLGRSAFCARPRPSFLASMLPS